ncbi:hypothetical protein KKG52_03940 [Patescibacteria group bacterium]|nr:hypothetical protein [Patescibacteria group bacterium]
MIRKISIVLFFLIIALVLPKEKVLSYGSVPPSYFDQSSDGISQCVAVRVGDPKTDPNSSQCKQITPPAGSAKTGYEQPKIITPHPYKLGYWQLPKSSDGSYKIYTCSGRTWGSKELVGVLYTVSKIWKQKHPSGWINIGDLNATGHKSHKWGRAVDLDATTNGKDWVADFTKGNYNREATIELGKMLVDTGTVRSIWYNDQAVNRAVLDYARQTGRSKNMNMKPITGHNNHFHLDIEIPLLSVWEPGC